LDRQFRVRLIEAVNARPVEDGFDHEAEEIVKEVLDRQDGRGREWLRTFVFDQEPALAAATLKCLGRISVPKSWALEVAETALRHIHVEVRDSAVQALELWSFREGVEILQSHREKVPWLREYISDVIRDLSE
jgi:hypothetical protein